MPATISSTGTWTVLKTPLTPILDTNITPRMETVSVNGADFTSFPTEIDQFIKLALAGFAQAQLGGTTANLGYWATVALIRDMLTAFINANVPNPH